jgi:peroxiredoxin Q/BCP
VTRDTVESNAHWTRRLRLPYPLLSDAEGEVGHAFGITRRVGIGGWKIEFFRRASILIDARGVVAAVWENVKVRGHATDVIEVARALQHPGS